MSPPPMDIKLFELEMLISQFLRRAIFPIWTWLFFPFTFSLTFLRKAPFLCILLLKMQLGENTKEYKKEKGYRNKSFLIMARIMDNLALGVCLN